MDPDERLRLFIQWTVIPHPIYVIRSPVPWHSAMAQRIDFCKLGLFVPSTMSLALNVLWHTKCVTGDNRVTYTLPVDVN